MGLGKLSVVLGFGLAGMQNRNLVSVAELSKTQSAAQFWKFDPIP
jgi:hypothetical protein